MATVKSMPALASSAQLKRLCTNLCDAGTMYPKHRDHNKVEGFFQMCVRQDLCFSNSTVNNGGRSDPCERGQIISRTKAEHFYRGRYLMRTTAISLQHTEKAAELDSFFMVNDELCEL